MAEGNKGKGKDKDKKPKKPKKKDFHIQIKASGAIPGTILTCTLSGFDPQVNTVEEGEDKIAFNFKTKKGVPAITEGQILAADINGQIFNVTVTGKKTTSNISLTNPTPSTP
jgi:hypothetical protein